VAAGASPISFAQSSSGRLDGVRSANRGGRLGSYLSPNGYGGWIEAVCGAVDVVGAIKAIAGIGVWLPEYDKMKYDTLKASSKVII